MNTRAGIAFLVAPALVLAAGMIFDIHSTLAAYLVAWIALMVLTYQGKRVEVPGAAGIAKSIAGKAAV